MTMASARMLRVHLFLGLCPPFFLHTNLFVNTHMVQVSDFSLLSPVVVLGPFTLFSANDGKIPILIILYPPPIFNLVMPLTLGDGQYLLKSWHH